MEFRKRQCDNAYLKYLPQAPVNPLKREQKQWEQLSPSIDDFLANFKGFIEQYSPASVNETIRKQLLSFIDEWWNLLQKWNDISDSYKPKVNQLYACLQSTGIQEI